MKLFAWLKELTTPKVVPLTLSYYVNAVWRINIMILLALAYSLWRHNWFLDVLCVVAFSVWDVWMPLTVLRRMKKPSQTP